jgi:hypothetical protein
MKRFLSTALLACVLPLSGLAGPFAATLFLNVDTSAQEYYLSGSASGSPYVNDFGPFAQGSQIFYSNYQPTAGGYASWLSLDAFTVTGNTASHMTLYIHGNGNINGAINFAEGSALTLAGKESQRYSYATWDTSVITALEGKATVGEILVPTQGDVSFAIQFKHAPAAIPEPSTVAAIFGAVALAGVVVHRRRVQRAERE